jgi:hypothetical protein
MAGVGGQTWELAPGSEGGTVLRTTAADGGVGKCLAPVLQPSASVCNESAGVPLQVCDCGGQADCGYHRHCATAMEFVVRPLASASAAALAGSQSPGAMQLASRLNPDMCLTAGTIPHTKLLNITLQVS